MQDDDSSKKRSIDYDDAKKLCEEKITLAHLRNDKYNSQNQLGGTIARMKVRKKEKNNKKS